MTNYEFLADEAINNGLIIKEKPLTDNDGRIRGNRIAIRKNIDTLIEKTCILAEELGHYHTTTGNILDQQSLPNRKQEQRARLWAYDRLIGLIGIVECFKAGCQTLFEMAEHLGVTEEFLLEALERYRQKYGEYITVDHYIIYFEPHLAVAELL